MNAPFFNDPPNPGGPAGEPFPGLWEYEGKTSSLDSEYLFSP
jgi:hypothetical protein